MANDNFDLKKYLKENKVVESYNPYTKEDTKTSINEGNLREKIKSHILKELESDEDYELEDRKIKYGVNPELEGGESEDHINPGNTEEDDKKRKEYFDKFGEPDFLSEEEEESEEEESEEVEDEEITDEDDEEITPEGAGGLEDIAADMGGTEGDVMDHLMSALKVAKGMDNEKLVTQIGNTLKFFVSEYIGGE